MAGIDLCARFGAPPTTKTKKMSSDYSPSGGRRSRSRGGRRQGGRPRGSSSSSSSRQERPAKIEKKTIWQQIIGFFTGKSGASSNGHSSKTAPAARQEGRVRPERTERTERPERTERTERTERPARTPESIEVTSPRLYVGNLSFDAGESDLFELFNGVGIVQNVEVVSNRHTQKSKGFAFVQMQTVDEAKRAVSELHDKDYMGRKLVVSGAKAMDEKRPERARQPEQ
jgi:hypothetical protein